METATLALPYLIALIGIALLFDFLNGLHDAANSIATIVSTRVLRPQYAVLWAAFFNFIAFLFFGLHVAQTLGTGIVDAGIVDPQVILSALVGAIVWNVATWVFGIPSSSSHALIGGLVGAGITKAGPGVVVWSGLGKTVAAIVLSPLLGFVLALLLVLVVSWACVRSTPFGVDRTFRGLQFVSASLYSLGHGGNDAQKTMGIIAVLLYAQGHLGQDFHVPLWWFCPANRRWRWAPCRAAGASSTRWARASPGSTRCRASAPRPAAPSPCSSPHGSACRSRRPTPSPGRSSASAQRRASAVRWGLAGNIVIAWVVTLPAAAGISAGCYLLTRLVAP